MPHTDLVQTVSVTTTDFEQLRESSVGWDQRYDQLSPGRFQGGNDMRIIGSRQIFRHYFGRRIRYQGMAPKGTFAVGLPFQQTGTARFAGEIAEQDTVILHAPDHEAEFFTPEFWDGLVLCVSQDEVRAITASLSPKGHLSSKSHGVCALRPEVAERLRKEGREFLRRSKDIAPDDHEQVARWSVQFTRLFLWEVINAQEGALRAVRSSKPERIVKKATELAMADTGELVGLVDICDQLGVSLRTLHYAFQDVTGMSPATWLRTLRLNRVYRRLQRACADTTRIKQVATSNGFYHLGHFSQHYKRHFGCLPSETLGSS